MRRLLSVYSALTVVVSVVVGAWVAGIAGRFYSKINPVRPWELPRAGWKPWRNWFPTGWWYWNWSYALLLIFLSVVGIGLALPTFRRLRSLGRRAAWAPGLAAVSVSLAVLIGKALKVGFEIRYLPPQFRTATSDYENIFSEFSYQSAIPWAILGAWAWVWISGRWRRRLPGWEERIGRWYGWAWISTILWYDLGWSVLWG